MAVTENDLIVGPLIPANGVSLISLDFYFEAEEWLSVYKSGSESPLVLDTDYTVAGEGTDSGSITLTTPANGTDTYSVYLEVPLERSSDLQQRGQFRSSPFNIEMDRVWQRLQHQQTQINRSLRVGKTSASVAALESVSAAARQGRGLVFSADGTKLEVADFTGVDVTAAEGFATAAATARDKAQDWAEEVEDTEVETGQFSALHHAAKAEASAGAAAASAGSASTSAGTATTQAGLSATARDKAEEWAEKAEDTEVETGQFSALHHAAKAADSATAAAATLAEFETIYLGAFATAPTLDNEGNALIVGAEYFNTVDDARYVWDGTSWLSVDYNSANVAITGGVAVGLDKLLVGASAWTWLSGWNGIKIGEHVAVQGGGASNRFAASSNAALGASGWEYTITGQKAAAYQISAGAHLWTSAPSGTDGNTVSFVEFMRLTDAGDLGIGTDTPAAKLDVVGDIKVSGGIASVGAAPLNLTHYADSAGAMVTKSRRGRGTSASPTALLAADQVWRHYVEAHDGTAFRYMIEQKFDLQGWNGIQPYGRFTIRGEDSAGTNKDMFWVDGDGGGFDGPLALGGGIETTSGLMRINGSNGEGDATQPHYSFRLDPDTGMFRFAANELGISTGGVQRMHFDDAGNVGIGTTAPEARFHVETPDGGNFVLFEGTSFSQMRLKASTNRRVLGLKADGNTASQIDFQDDQMEFGGTTTTTNLWLTLNDDEAVFEKEVKAPAVVGQFNAKYHGVKADGVTDDSAAMLTALNNAINNSGTLELPAGEILLNSRVNKTLASAANFGIEGRGSNVTKIIVPSTNTSGAFSIDGTASRSSQAQFRGFAVWAQGNTGMGLRFEQLEGGAQFQRGVDVEDVWCRSENETSDHFDTPFDFSGNWRARVCNSGYVGAVRGNDNSDASTKFSTSTILDLTGCYSPFIDNCHFWGGATAIKMDHYLGNITSIASADGGAKSLVTVSNGPHPFSTTTTGTKPVRIIGTSSYDGEYYVTNVSSTTFQIHTAFVGTDTGTCGLNESPESGFVEKTIINHVKNGIYLRREFGREPLFIMNELHINYRDRGIQVDGAKLLTIRECHIYNEDDEVEFAGVPVGIDLVNADNFKVIDNYMHFSITHPDRVGIQVLGDGTAMGDWGYVDRNILSGDFDVGIRLGSGTRKITGSNKLSGSATTAVANSGVDNAVTLTAA